MRLASASATTKPLTRLREIRLHALRYTCTPLQLTRIPYPKIVFEMLGHSSIAITLDTYSHVITGFGDTAALAMEDVLRS